MPIEDWPTDDCTVDCAVPDTVGCEQAGDHQPPGAASPSARLLPRRLALSGLAALAGSAVAAAVAGPAGAQTDTTGPEGTDDTSPTTEPATTTTAPPKPPTTSDIPMLGFAQSLEFAAAVLYDQALPLLSEEIRLEATVFRRHHQAYGEQIGALLGRRAPGVANQTLVTERTPAFGARSEPAIIQAAYALESSLAATNTELLAQLTGTDGLTLVASIQPIEARQSVVLGQAIEIDGDDLLPVLEGGEPEAEVFTRSAYPIA